MFAATRVMQSGAGGARFWRVLVTDSRSLYGYFTSLAEIQFLSESGVSAVTGSPSASSSDPSSPAANAFDGSPATYWLPQQYQDGPQWVGAQAPVPVEIHALRLRSDPSNGDILAPLVFDVQRSSDGTNYATVYRSPAQPPWSAGETRAFSW